MSTYRYAVKVRKTGIWYAHCPACGEWTLAGRSRDYVWRLYRWAVDHAATCESLHRANWNAACRSCKTYGRVAPVCLVCLGRGYEAEREGLA